jgi:hypothetical protein
MRRRLRVGRHAPQGLVPCGVPGSGERRRGGPGGGRDASFEPSWFWESIPLFVKGRTFACFNVPGFAAYWVSGDDYGRMVSAALTRDLGREEVVPVQGPERLGLEEAGRRFIRAYDPSIGVRKVPFWMVRLLGLVNADVQELVHLFGMYSRWREPAPVPEVWERFGKPRLDATGYAAYVRQTGDFPQKG